VADPDQRRWDYRHQVLAQPLLQPWQLFAGVKWMELWFHLRPRRVWQVLRTGDRLRRRQLLWCALHTGLVWWGEVAEFVLRAMNPFRRPRPAATVAGGRRFSLPVHAAREDSPADAAARSGGALCSTGVPPVA
jgi:hypothetical protein